MILNMAAFWKCVNTIKNVWEQAEKAGNVDENCSGKNKCLSKLTVAGYIFFPLKTWQFFWTKLFVGFYLETSKGA